MTMLQHDSARAVPPVVDRETWQRTHEALRATPCPGTRWWASRTRRVGGGLSDDRGLLSFHLRVGDRVFPTNETTHRGVKGVMAQVQLLDMTVYGRQEEWEDSPEGWPQHPTGTWWTADGRPVPQWARPGAAPAGAVAAPRHH